MAESDLDPEAFAALFRGEPNRSSRRYTLEITDGHLIFRRCELCAAFDAALDDLFGTEPEAGDYSVIVVTEAGPKRM